MKIRFCGCPPQSFAVSTVYSSTVCLYLYPWGGACVTTGDELPALPNLLQVPDGIFGANSYCGGTIAVDFPVSFSCDRDRYSSL
ncbi:MAG TPA: hypothetical protein V6D12_22240 [Candidatus Obscuribacterales bacterium]